MKATSTHTLTRALPRETPESKAHAITQQVIRLHQAQADGYSREVLSRQVSRIMTQLLELKAEVKDRHPNTVPRADAPPDPTSLMVAALIDDVRNVRRWVELGD